MTDAEPAPVVGLAGGGTTPPPDTAAPLDPVLAALEGVGAPVDGTGLGSLPLEGPHVLWLVADGAMDVFAVDAAQQGQRHFLGRLGAGTLLLGPVTGPEHTLVARPLAGCWLRRIELHELAAPPVAHGGTHPDPASHPYYSDGAAYGAAQQDVWGGPWGGWGDDTGQVPPSPLDQAFTLGVGRGLQALYQAPLEGGMPDAAEPGGADEDILWLPIAPGCVQYGSPPQQQAAAPLLIHPATWQLLVDQQHRLLRALDRWIDQLERAHAERAAAGVKAGEAANTQANQVLLDAIGRPGAARQHGRPRGRRDAPTNSADAAQAAFAACRLVAEDLRMALAEPAAANRVSGQLDPVERIAVASRVRTREVRLSGRWWRENTGPLVGRRATDGAPVALLWRRGGYVVVDPAAGTRERVDRNRATGRQALVQPRALMFYRPLPDTPMGPLGMLRFSLRGTRDEFRRLALGGLVAVGLGALVPIATGQVLGSYVPQRETGLIMQAGVALIACGVVAATFMLMQNVALLRMEGRVEATLQPAVWDRLLRLPTTFFAGRSTGELASAAMGVSAIRRVLSGIAAVSVQATTVGAVNLVLLVVYSPSLALAACAMLLVVVALFVALGLLQLRYQRRLVRLSNKLNNQAFQTLRGLPKLRVAAAESFAYAAWAREFARTRDLQQRVGRLQNAVTVLNAVYLPLCMLGMFMLLAGPARDSMSAASFLTFSTAMTMTLASVTQLTGALLSAGAVLPMIEQVRPIFRARPEVTHGSAQPGELSGRIEVRDLTYRYTDDGPLVLDGVSFDVQPGEFVAVVGPSGCGKSTLLRLLIGFDRPLSGSVRFDGQDLAALDQAAVRRQCGVVLQHAQPLSGSILDCIRGTDDFTLEEAWEAAAMAGLAEDIKAMPMGMHTVLSDGGGSISGGQRQRLMIARALVRRPRILLFDEATSALDNEAQRVVIESTRGLHATRIVIAHRLSTIMDADRVIALSHGRVVQEGAPAALLADAEGLFYELVRRQMQ